MPGGDDLWTGVSGQRAYGRLQVWDDGKFVYLVYGYHLLVVAVQRAHLTALIEVAT